STPSVFAIVSPGYESFEVPEANAITKSTGRKPATVRAKRSRPHTSRVMRRPLHSDLTIARVENQGFSGPPPCDQPTTIRTAGEKLSSTAKRKIPPPNLLLMRHVPH